MSRKDHIALAKVLRDSRPATTSAGFNLWQDIRRGIARMLANDNPRFDQERFYAATGEK